MSEIRSVAAEAAHVGADSLRLTGGVELEDVLRVDPVGVRQREDRAPHALVLHGDVLVEDGRDEDRHDGRHEGDEGNRDDGAPDPPRLPRATQDRIEDRNDERSQDRCNGETLELIAQPRTERHVGEAVVVLAEEPLVDRQREGEDGRHDEIHRPEEGDVDETQSRDASRGVSHLRRGARVEEQEADPARHEEVPELQPVAAFEVRIGCGTRLGGHRREVGLRGGVWIERHRGGGRRDWPHVQRCPRRLGGRPGDDEKERDEDDEAGEGSAHGVVQT